MSLEILVTRGNVDPFLEMVTRGRRRAGRKTPLRVTLGSCVIQWCKCWWRGTSWWKLGKTLQGKAFFFLQWAVLRGIKQGTDGVFLIPSWYVKERLKGPSGQGQHMGMLSSSGSSCDGAPVGTCFLPGSSSHGFPHHLQNMHSEFRAGNEVGQSK